MRTYTGVLGAGLTALGRNVLDLLLGAVGEVAGVGVVGHCLNVVCVICLVLSFMGGGCDCWCDIRLQSVGIYTYLPTLLLVAAACLSKP